MFDDERRAEIATANEGVRVLKFYQSLLERSDVVVNVRNDSNLHFGDGLKGLGLSLPTCRLVTRRCSWNPRPKGQGCQLLARACFVDPDLED